MALEVSFGELEDIVSVDPGLTAKILKVANSAMYARQREITSLRMAISLLGFKNIKSLVMLVAASSMLARRKDSRFYPDYWRHSINTAFHDPPLRVIGIPGGACAWWIKRE